jgi:hypothetical protein
VTQTAALVAAQILALAACRTVQGAGAPAVIVRPTPESRTALVQAVENALSGQRVTLDDDALTQEGALTIDRTRLRDPSDLALHGGDPAAPGRGERFHLIKDGEHCILIHDRTDRRYLLVGTTCAPL